MPASLLPGRIAANRIALSGLGNCKRTRVGERKSCPLWPGANGAAIVAGRVFERGGPLAQQTSVVGDPGASLLLTDLYQLTMLQSYFEHGMTEVAVFEFFVRKLPERRSFLVAAGLEQAVEFLEQARFTETELAWLAKSKRFPRDFVDRLAELRFTGNVHAPPEGTVLFADEPVIRVAAPLPQAQLVETRLINILHFQTLIASKAARMALAAPGRRLIDFGLRRAHGAEAGLMAARASYIAGFAGTATVPAEPRYGVPIYGTMAHSFIQAHDSEEEAFENFARSRPQSVILLIDTYDTEAGAEKVAQLAPKLAADGITVAGVRLDSGDLADHARKVRKILDGYGLTDVSIFASGGIDEDALQEFVRAGAPIDGFGIGTSLTTSSDVAALDCAYKLQEYAGRPKRKRSEGKATWPGRKQVFRRCAADGRMEGDVLTVEGDAQDGEALIRPVMKDGKRLAPPPSLDRIREYCAAELARLPEPLSHLAPGAAYPVTVADALRDLAAQVDRETR
ncbi:MAG: nicotinate phosphoribosyltransferase [Rhodospirillales bacterium]|nr:MAG: nicotinate phosphoribosyltransferase [Rhodospirillales bacterium]